jgi:hypothetical protein
MGTEISLGMDNSVGAEPLPPSPIDAEIEIDLDQPVGPTPEPVPPPTVEFAQSFENHPDAQLLRETFETVSQNLKDYNSTLEYSNGKLVRKIYTNGTRAIVKTLNYSGARLTSIVLSGDTPYGIPMTKTLGYTGDNLTSVGYS